VVFKGRLINRDQRTPIFEPEKWNRNSLVVDAWAGSTAFYPVPQKTLGILQKINPVFAKTKKIVAITSHFFK
jgi:NAD(P)H-hydrate repair Nnr-like enzyme with NAD(P)H-hydrate epimerase domain